MLEQPVTTGELRYAWREATQASQPTDRAIEAAEKPEGRVRQGIGGSALAPKPLSRRSGMSSGREAQPRGLPRVRAR